ncbi:hypothetical protein [Aquisphaera insulae]|uniref:hypothetical protein n=1 Tax=Aquisphaera insulae TaxID=2712864 RepID=UPI0013EB1081|nr:hypothetical protein [Aquisphaera insulae]
MLKPGATFAEVKAALIGLGFRARYTPKHVFFKHSSGAPFFALPRYAPDQRLSSIHALTIRTQLEEAGLIEDAELPVRSLVGRMRQSVGGSAKVKKTTGPAPKAPRKPAPPKAGKKVAPKAVEKTPATKVKAHV